MPKLFIFTIGLITFLSRAVSGIAAEIEAQTIFIPVYQHFNFEQGRIIDSDFGDITALDEGIETTLPKEDIAALHKGFLEDVKALPPDEEIRWLDYAPYSLDMLYVVRDTDNKYSVFELVDVKMSQGYVLGIEIKYKYQPDGSRNF